MSDYLVECIKGEFGRDSMLVRGDIVKWLVDKKVKPTKHANRFNINGWRIVITPLADTVVPIAETIFDKKYA